MALIIESGKKKPRKLAWGAEFRNYTRALGFLLFYSSPLFSDWAHNRAGTEDFTFLAQTPTARAAGLAGAHTAGAIGMDALGTNTAGLAAMEKGTWVSMGYRYNALGVHSGEIAYPFQDSHGICYAISMQYTNYGSVEEVSEEGIKSGSRFFPANHTPAFHMAASFFNNLRTGMSFKLPTEYLGGFEHSQWALGWAFDMGLQFQPKTKRLSLGAVLKNAGRKEISHISRGDRGGALPLILKTGLTYHSLNLKNAVFVLDLNLPYHYTPYLSGGVEYKISRYFILRAGSRFNLPETKALFEEFVLDRQNVFPDRSAVKAAGGFSLNQNTFAIEYAAQYWHWLGMVHWFTVKWRV